MWRGWLPNNSVMLISIVFTTSISRTQVCGTQGNYFFLNYFIVFFEKRTITLFQRYMGLIENLQLGVNFLQGLQDEILMRAILHVIACTMSFSDLWKFVYILEMKKGFRKIAINYHTQQKELEYCYVQ